MEAIIETKRFILRELLPTDAEVLFLLDSDPEVHRYLGNQPLTKKEEAFSVIEFVRKQYVDNGIGRWAVIDKETHDFIGWSGLKWMTETVNGHSNFYDIGYRLRRKYWGKGIATETASACLNYAFAILKAPTVYGMADCENIASNKVLQKIGLNFIEVFDYEDATKCNWYKLDKQEIK